MTNMRKAFESPRTASGDTRLTTVTGPCREDGATFTALRHAQGQLAQNRRPAVLFLGTLALSQFLQSEAGADFIASSSDREVTAEMFTYYSNKGSDYVSQMLPGDIDGLVSLLADHMDDIYSFCQDRILQDPEDYDTCKILPLITATANFVDMAMRAGDPDYKNESNIIKTVAADPYVTARFVAEMIPEIADRFKGHAYREALLTRRAQLMFNLGGCYDSELLDHQQRRLMMSLLEDTSVLFTEIGCSVNAKVRGLETEEETGLLSDITAFYNWKQFTDAPRPAQTTILKIRPASAP